MSMNKEKQGDLTGVQAGGAPAHSKAVKSRKFKHGALATVISVLFIVAVVVVNMIVSVLGEKFPLKVDLTQEQVFQLSQASIDFIQGLDRDVNITVLSTESDFTAGGTYYTQANTVIRQYAQYSDRISVEYVDTAKNPAILNKYDTKEEKLTAGSILVESGDRHIVVEPVDLFNIETSYDQSTFQQTNYIKSSKAEQSMTSAILNVTSDDQVKVALLTGYSEADSSGFVDLLKKNNYNVVEQNIVTAEEIDPEAQIAIIYAPERDYDETALKKLNDFMSNNERYGKTVLMAAAQNQSSEQMPFLTSFLAEWNISVPGGVVCETNTNYLFGMNYFYNISDYADTTYTEKLPNKELPVAVPQSKQIEVLNTDMVKVLLQSSEDAVIFPMSADKDWTPEGAESVGKIPTAVMSTKTKYDGTTPLVGNVIVVGSSYALDSTFLSYNSFNNSAYFLNIFNTITDREDTITIESKEVNARELGINQTQVNTNGVIFMGIVPAAVLAVGLVIWIRRRNR